MASLHRCQGYFFQMERLIDFLPAASGLARAPPGPSSADGMDLKAIFKNSKSLKKIKAPDFSEALFL